MKVKELRYVLQLSGQDNKLVNVLGEVKDSIGEWHDWVELDAIASEVLHHRDSCGVREQIHAGAQHRFDKALVLANQLRRKYLGGSTSSRGGRGTRAKSKAKIHVLRATSDLAA
jgi:hypothetical protein